MVSETPASRRTSLQWVDTQSDPLGFSLRVAGQEYFLLGIVDADQVSAAGETVFSSRLPALLQPKVHCEQLWTAATQNTTTLKTQNTTLKNGLFWGFAGSSDVKHHVYRNVTAFHKTESMVLWSCKCTRTFLHALAHTQILNWFQRVNTYLDVICYLHKLTDNDNQGIWGSNAQKPQK